MLKTYITTALFAGLFAMTSVYANEHGESHEGAEHPAHEMSQPKDAIQEKDSKADKSNKHKAEESENAPHPAHEMDENQELQERGQ